MLSSFPIAVLTLLSLLNPAGAAPTDHHASPETLKKRTLNGKCTTFTFPVTASAMNFNIQVPQNLNDPTVVEGFILSSISAAAGAALGTLGRSETNGTFTMSAIYCEPDKLGTGRAKTIQYLQHAITMRKEYFSGLTFPEGFNGEQYSYIATLLDNGYRLIAVDNLAAGQSSHPDAVSVAQQPMQVAVIHEILQMLRAGTVPGPVAGKSFDKVIYTGHSYGSICGNAIATHYPADVDTFVLTGYSGQFALGAPPLAGGILLPASTVSPRFSNLQAGYLAMSSEKGRSQGLYTSPNARGGFDPGMPPYDFANEDTGSLGEIATLLYGVGPADAFKGSVLAVTGQYDAIVCSIIPTQPNCGSGATSLPAQAGAFFPNAKSYDYYIPPNTGHNAFLHYSSPATFKYIIDYLAAHGY